MLRRDADWGSLVEAIQAPAGDDEEWADGIVRRGRSLVEPGIGIGLGIMDHDGTPLSLHTRLIAEPPGRSGMFRIPRGSVTALSPPAFRAFFEPKYLVSSHLEIERHLDPEDCQFTRGFRAMNGTADIVGILARPEPQSIVALSLILPEARPIARADRELLTKIALHLETGYRLRKQPESIKAVLDADGRVIHREQDAPPDDVLSAHARGHGELDLWTALVAGRLSLVARGRGRQRRLYFLENPPDTRLFRAFSTDEVAVLRHASSGLSTKLVAYGLGISPSKVSTSLASAASKVGAASRTELVRVAALLMRGLASDLAEEPLTDAERDVLDLLRQGLTNREIANLRLRSVRTIANQVASLLRKTGAPSRRALVAR